jgi:transcriptional regulator with XRE-family HTH domain
MATKTPDAVDIQIGKLIRSQRLALAMSQTTLAEKLGLAFQQVQKYEKGINRVGSGRLAKIADALGVEPSYFFSGNGNAGNGHSNSGGAEILTLIGTAGAMKLLRAFAEIKDANARRTVVLLAEALRDLRV